eukprot:3696542-Rhodomonas_salina.2
MSATDRQRAAAAMARAARQGGRERDGEGSQHAAKDPHGCARGVSEGSQTETRPLHSLDVHSNAYDREPASTQHRPPLHPGPTPHPRTNLLADLAGQRRAWPSTP